MISSTRPGVVLLIALLCLLALEVTAVGLHFIARQELRTGTAAARDTELRIAAQSAAAHAIHAWPADSLAGVAVGDSIVVPAASVQSPDGIITGASIERVNPSLFLIRAYASSPLRERVRIGLLVAATTAEDLARPLTTAVRTNGAIHISGGSSITGSSDVCADATAAIEVRGQSDVNQNGGTISGAVVFSPAPIVDRISTLDRLALESIGRASGGAAITFHRGDTVVTGKGQGLLVVIGNVTMDGGQFDGIVIVYGSLTLTDGARLNGAALVDGGGITLNVGSVRFDGCAIRAALDSPWLMGPFRTGRRLWIPLF